jgi:predicted ATP-dependent endonuclease of OLD family
METKKNYFLSQAILKGYKSVENINIEFYDGLNIIIGKNAAGKTNFLNFLYNSLTSNHDSNFEFSSELIYKGVKEISVKSNSEHPFIKDKKVNQEQFLEEILLPKIKSVVKVDGNIIKNRKSRMDNVQSKLLQAGLATRSTFIRHGIPKDYKIVDIPLKLTITTTNLIPTELGKLLQQSDLPEFVRSLAVEIFFSIPDNDNQLEEKIREAIKNVFIDYSKLNYILSRYSPISDIRLSDNFNIFVAEDNDNIVINNLFLEFKIDGNWLPFSSLSDGTKRLFYILSEVYDFRTAEIYTGTDIEFKKFVLIEEPELGIHPHQFKKIMDFLLEESNTKQIFITTHSPQALNVINKDNLHRIIIAYNTPDGTKLRHLEEIEIDKAKAYIEIEFLSDYWVYSDLEK